jgi:hypothetical protein
MASKKTGSAAPKVQAVPSFSFDGVQAVETKPKGKAPSYPTVPTPNEHIQGMRDFLAAKKLEAEAETLRKSEGVVKFNAYAYDMWLTRGVTGTFASSIKFSSSFGDMLYVSARFWKKISTEEDAQFLRERLGVDNFNEMVTKSTTLTGDLNVVQEKFNELVASGKIDAKTANVVFTFMVETFKRDVSYEFKKDVLDWSDVFALAGGDKDLAAKVIDTTLGRKPYFREA